MAKGTDNLYSLSQFTRALCIDIEIKSPINTPTVTIPGADLEECPRSIFHRDRHPSSYRIGRKMF